MKINSFSFFYSRQSLAESDQVDRDSEITSRGRSRIAGLQSSYQGKF